MRSGFTWERKLLVALIVVICVGIGLFVTEKNGVTGLNAQNIKRIGTLEISLHRSSVLESRGACQRGVKDRHDNAEGWYSASVARFAQAKQGGPDAPVYLETARTYLGIARDLNSRTNPRNSVIWPLGSKKHPIGLGKLNCDQLFPLN